MLVFMKTQQLSLLVLSHIIILNVQKSQLLMIKVRVAAAWNNHGGSQCRKKINCKFARDYDRKKSGKKEMMLSVYHICHHETLRSNLVLPANSTPQLKECLSVILEKGERRANEARIIILNHVILMLSHVLLHAHKE